MPSPKSILVRCLLSLNFSPKYVTADIPRIYVIEFPAIISPPTGRRGCGENVCVKEWGLYTIWSECYIRTPGHCWERRICEQRIGDDIFLSGWMYDPNLLPFQKEWGWDIFVWIGKEVMGYVKGETCWPTPSLFRHHTGIHCHLTWL